MSDQNCPDTITYDMLLEYFSSSTSIADTIIYFSDDPEECDHYIGAESRFIPDKPYWAGYCDIPGGISFSSAQELFEAPIYDGKSIKDRWDHVELGMIAGLAPEDWLKYVWSKPH